MQDKIKTFVASSFRAIFELYIHVPTGCLVQKTSRSETKKQCDPVWKSPTFSWVLLTRAQPGRMIRCQIPAAAVDHRENGPRWASRSGVRWSGRSTLMSTVFYIRLGKEINFINKVTLVTRQLERLSYSFLTPRSYQLISPCWFLVRLDFKRRRTWTTYRYTSAIYFMYIKRCYKWSITMFI